MYGTNTAAQAADGHVAGRSQLACRRRCPPPPLSGQQASIAAAVSAWNSLTRSQAELAWTRWWRVEFPVAVSARLRLPTR
jgi:hypothetical protein